MLKSKRTIYEKCLLRRICVARIKGQALGLVRDDRRVAAEDHDGPLRMVDVGVPAALVILED